MMAEPQNKQEYLVRFTKSERITGYGAKVKTHFPCPFCAAPDWMVQPITDVIYDYKTMQSNHLCGECGRAGKFIVNHLDGGITTEFVQTTGDDPPDWLKPWPRRV